MLANEGGWEGEMLMFTVPLRLVSFQGEKPGVAAKDTGRNSRVDGSGGWTLTRVRSGPSPSGVAV